MSGAPLRLKLACWDYDRTRPLIDGRVKPEGVDLDIEVLRPRQMFPRMLEHREFDVSEISLASLTALAGRGDSPFVGVPVKLTNKGAEAVYEFELSKSEKEAFDKSVAANVELMGIARGFLG